MLDHVLNVWNDNNIKTLLCRRLFISDRIKQVNLVKSKELIANLELDCEKKCEI